MSTLKWSSPSRRLGAKNLDPIPLEVYLEIFGYFSENEDMTAQEAHHHLSKLALVCRFFSSIALPRIFEKMEFSGRPRARDSTTNTTSRFCRALLNNQEPARSLAQYIRICTFSSWLTVKNDSESVIRDAFLSMYCKALSKMHGVETIFFNSTLIDKPFLKVIKKLQNLHSLHFSQCSFPGGLDPNIIKSFAQETKLKALTIFFCFPHPTFHSIFTSTFNFQSLKSFEVDEWMVVQHLAGLNDSLLLETLTIHAVEDLYVLPALFQKTPELLTLHVYRISTGQEHELTSFALSTTVLPKLRFVDCPAALAAVLVPSRPIKKVWLIGTLMSSIEDTYAPLSLPPLDSQFLQALQNSTAVILEAVIPKHLCMIGSPQSYMPGVSTLKISWFHANWADDMFQPKHAHEVKAVLHDMFRNWAPNPSIRHIVFDFEYAAESRPAYLDLQSQNDILQTIILDAFPRIEQVNFATCVNWERSVLDGGWHPRVPRTKRAYLFLAWQSIRDKLVDYEGCFAAVFNTEGSE